MLYDMSHAIRASVADFAMGFDGDGDRGEEIFAHKIGVILARDLAQLYPRSALVTDVRFTSLFAADPVVRVNGAKAS